MSSFGLGVYSRTNDRPAPPALTYANRHRVATSGDVNLVYSESKTWLGVLQHYSSQADKQVRFLTPINRRRITLFLAMGIMGFIYVCLVIITWNLPFVIEPLLAR